MSSQLVSMNEDDAGFKMFSFVNDFLGFNNFFVRPEGNKLLVSKTKFIGYICPETTRAQDFLTPLIVWSIIQDQCEHGLI